MTAQPIATQTPNNQADSEEAAKVRRVLSVAEPKQAVDKSSSAQPKR